VYKKSVSPLNHILNMPIDTNPWERNSPADVVDQTSLPTSVSVGSELSDML
jgi:hypothetical protein